MRINVLDSTNRPNWVIAGIVLLGFLLRLHVVAGSTYHHDEEREWIPFAQSISLTPGEINLPIRVISHPILPAYLIKAGSLIAGENPIGFRLMSLLAGTATILVVALAALRWAGFWAAFWAASLLAFNEYHIYVSSLAIDKPFQLFFSAVAIAYFLRFLETEKTRALFVAGAMTGVAFLCKETTVLLLPGFFLGLLFSARHRAWLLRPAPYVAILVFAVVILPDVLANVLLADELGFTYADHVQRAAGIGFERNHFLFFARDAIAFVYDLRGEQLRDLAPEYAAMNSLTGLLFLGVATLIPVWLIMRPDARHDGRYAYLAAAFWTVFGFFLFTEVSTEGAIEHLTYVSWFWSDLTLMPAALMTGGVLSAQTGIRRAVSFGTAGVAALIAIGAAGFARVGTSSAPVVGFNPEYLLPPDGRLVEVDVRFNYCGICEKAMRPTLLDVVRRDSEGNRSSVLGTDWARVAPGSTDGTRLVLRARDADPAENPDERWWEVMWYEIRYSLTDANGNVHEVQGRVFSPLHPSEFPPRFWTGEPHLISLR